MLKIKSILIILIILFAGSIPVKAQSNPVLPVYIVQSGDTLYSIAVRFAVNINDILAVNDIPDPNTLKLGTEIKIPGFDGIAGVLHSTYIQPLDTIRSLSLQSHISPAEISRLSRTTSPNELYLGSEVFSLDLPAEQKRLPAGLLKNGENIEEAALLIGANPWAIRLYSRFSDENILLPGDTLLINQNYSEKNATRKTFPEIEISPTPVYHGKTFVIKVGNIDQSQVSATFNNVPLIFHDNGDGNRISLASTLATQTPGLLPLTLQITRDNTPVLNSTLDVLIRDANYGKEYVVGVEAVTLQEDSINQEAQVLQGVIQNTDQRLWLSPMKYPLDEPCLGSTFGKARDYNNGAYFYYHSGLDLTICKANNLNIYAAAPGKVVYSGTLPIRGLFTLIDHGWGVYSGYAHQEESKVTPGQEVAAGDLIGIVGNTGRSAGPHLHFEIWVNGIPVDPLQWLDGQNLF